MMFSGGIRRDQRYEMGQAKNYLNWLIFSPRKDDTNYLENLQL